MYIDPKKAQHLVESNRAIIVDVRTDIEYMTEHIPGSLHIPLNEVSKSLQETDKEVIFLCRSGVRASKAHSQIKKGTVLKGGILAWKEAALPTKRDLSVWEMDRQVRLGAGLLVIAGIVLSFVHPWFLAISAFCRIRELCYASLTNSCGMAGILAKMPHNKKTLIH